MALIAILMCVNFTACSDDDEEPKTYEELLIGTWEEIGNEGLLLTFQNNGIGKLHIEGDDELTEPFTWEVVDSTINIDFEVSSNITMIIKELMENTLVVTDNSGTFTVTYARK